MIRDYIHEDWFRFGRWAHELLTGSSARDRMIAEWQAELDHENQRIMELERDRRESDAILHEQKRQVDEMLQRLSARQKSEIYRMLTPEQRLKVDEHLELRRIETRHGTTHVAHFDGVRIYTFGS